MENKIYFGTNKIFVGDEPIMDSKIYIGDGAYAAINSIGELVLTTENGMSVQNTVVIEPEVYPKLEEFVKQLRFNGVGKWKE